MSEKFIPISAQFDIKWNGKNTSDAASAAAFYGLYKSAEYYMKHVKEKIGKEGNGVPSNPGEPPHKQTGNLYDSVELVADKSQNTVWVTIDSAKAPYWYYLEYGTKHMAARPFWRISQAEAGPAMLAIASLESKKAWIASGYGTNIVTSEPTITELANKARQGPMSKFVGFAKSIIGKIKNFRKR